MKKLPEANEGALAFGRETLMNGLVAAHYGIPYVHLMAFAIDLERIVEKIEGDLDRDTELTSAWPAGWEIFLMQIGMLTLLEVPKEKTDLDPRDMMDDIATEVLGGGNEDMPPFGSSLVFAHFDLMKRGLWTQESLRLYDSWGNGPKQLREDLDSLWVLSETIASELAEACLNVELMPPVAPSTQQILLSLQELDELAVPIVENS